MVKEKNCQKQRLLSFLWYKIRRINVFCEDKKTYLKPHGSGLLLTLNLLLPRVQGGGEEHTPTLKYAHQRHNKIFHTLSRLKRSVETKIDTSPLH